MLLCGMYSFVGYTINTIFNTNGSEQNGRYFVNGILRFIIQTQDITCTIIKISAIFSYDKISNNSALV